MGVSGEHRELLFWTEFESQLGHQYCNVLGKGCGS